jgi:hypothetical protein
VCQRLIGIDNGQPVLDKRNLYVSVSRLKKKLALLKSNTQNKALSHLDYAGDMKNTLDAPFKFPASYEHVGKLELAPEAKHGVRNAPATTNVARRDNTNRVLEAEKGAAEVKAAAAVAQMERMEAEMVRLKIGREEAAARVRELDVALVAAMAAHGKGAGAEKARRAAARGRTRELQEEREREEVETEKEQGCEEEEGAGREVASSVQPAASSTRFRAAVDGSSYSELVLEFKAMEKKMAALQGIVTAQHGVIGDKGKALTRVNEDLHKRLMLLKVSSNAQANMALRDEITELKSTNRRTYDELRLFKVASTGGRNGGTSSASESFNRKDVLKKKEKCERKTSEWCKRHKFIVESIERIGRDEAGALAHIARYLAEDKGRRFLLLSKFVKIQTVMEVAVNDSVKEEQRTEEAQYTALVAMLILKLG